MLFSNPMIKFITIGDSLFAALYVSVKQRVDDV